MSEARIVPPLYRAVLRLAQAFDREPAAKLLIHARVVGDQSLYSAAVSDFLGGRHRFYLSPESDVKLKDVVIKYFRMPLDGTKGGAALDERIDAAFLAVRELSGIWHRAVTHIVAPKSKKQRRQMTGGDVGAWPEDAVTAAGQQQQAEETIAPLSFSAKPTKTLGPGVLLLSHPMMGGDMFKRAVILLIEHHGIGAAAKKEDAGGGDDDSESLAGGGGSYGLILNRMTDYDVHSAVKGGLSPDFFKAFAHNPIRWGGPVPRLQVLHRSELVGGVAVKKGGAKVFVSGDIDKAASTVSSGKGKSADFQFFVGCCTWQPGQLEDEIERGYWITATAPPTVSIEYRPHLWREALLKLGGKHKHTVEVPETVLHGMTDLPGVT